MMVRGETLAKDTEEDTRDFHLRWAALQPPQRPIPGICDMMRPLLAARPGPGLQLGVTPEIALASDHGIAVDWNADMIRIAWPGNSATHRAQVGNWLALDFAPNSFATAFGDGSLTMLSFPGDYRLLMRNLAKVLRPGGRLVLRCFVRPDRGETIAELARAVWAGETGQFSAFKLRLNMATAAIDNRVCVTGADIHAQFETYFGDRERLAKTTGWNAADFAHIDAYRNAKSVHAYPTRAEIPAILPENSAHWFMETAGYPLAERCPLLIVDFPT